MTTAVVIISPADTPAQTCVDDVTNRVNNCTANDVTIARLNVLQEIDGCTSEDDTATLILQAELVAGSFERYDVGLFIAQDGGDSRTGSCFHSFFTPISTTPNPTSGVGPFLNAETGDSNDVCGDIAQGVTNLYNLPQLVVPCHDVNGDGLVDIGTTVSWDNNTNTTCHGAADAVPGTKAKCNTEFLTINLVIPTPTPTNTPQDTPTNTPTATATATDTATPTATDSATATATDTVTATPTDTPEDTPTSTPTVTDTPTATATDTATATATDTATATPTQTPEDTPTSTPTVTDTPTATPTDTQVPPPPPGNAICRTAGFWSTHGAITQDVIDAAGQCVEICGEVISTTGVNDADSALEALCTKVGGVPERQLARQLTAAALNCVVSGGGGDCTGTVIESLFADCTQTCETGASVGGRDVQDCIDEVDCFNNGGVFALGFCQTGTCSDNDEPCNAGDLSRCLAPGTAACIPLPDNCHDQPLCNEDAGLCFPDPGPATSAKECNDARKSACEVIETDPGNTGSEADCASGLKQDEESCSDAGLSSALTSDPVANCPCEGPTSGGQWRSRGAYLQCATTALRQALQDGSLTRSAYHEMKRGVARSTCGAENKTRCCLALGQRSKCVRTSTNRCSARGGTDIGAGSCHPNPCAGP